MNLIERLTKSAKQSERYMNYYDCREIWLPMAISIVRTELLALANKWDKIANAVSPNQLATELREKVGVRKVEDDTG